MKNFKHYMIGFGIILLFSITSTFAQSQVKELQDLIGTNGKTAETELEKRGYTYIKKNRAGEETYSYWLNEKSKKCIINRITRGRVKSIMITKEADCKRYRPKQ